MIELPTMTDPLSRSWDQPAADQMAVYDDIAIMDRSTLVLLPEYSMSIPTGVYDGKMWRCALGHDQWLLCWYGPSDDPERCFVNRRPIRLIRDKAIRSPRR